MIGQLVGNYKILEKLGEGGMGAVYQAEQISLKRTVAIKLLRPDVSASPMLLRRFNAEAEAVAKLRHPSTVNIYDFGQDVDGTLFIAMELIEGRSLRTVIHHEAPLPLRRALAIAAQVAASLADAHAKTIIHRDLKPDNVMLADRGRAKDNVTVLDFGIAKLRDDSRGTQHQMTQAGDMLGTPQYMAPEQIRGEQIDGRTDVYALGCMIYEMLTARQPYEATTVMALLSKHLLEQAIPPSQRRPDLMIPAVADDLVMSALAKDPAARPPTMEDYGERIAAVLASLPQDGTAQRAAVVGAPSGPGQAPRADTPPAFSAGAGSVSVSGFAPPSMPPPGPMTPPPPGPATPPAVGYAQGPPSAGYPPPYAGSPAPYAPAPYPGGTPPAQPSPYASRPAASGGGSMLMWVLVAVLLLGAGGAGIYFATRGAGGKAIADARAADVDELDPDHPDPDPPDDPVGPHASPLPGKVVDVAQGVKIVAPPGMPVKRNQDAVMIGDPITLAIFGVPITGIASNDPDAIARWYARSNNLKQMEARSGELLGATRKVYTFSGKLNGLEFVQIGVPFLGPGYRVAVIIHMSQAAAQANPQWLEAQILEVFAGRIILPSRSP
jgi:serine/threonine protein kinase